MVNIQKCAIIGCGFVGTTCAFSLVQSGLFSELVLLDVDSAKADGEAMDLSHGIPFVRSMKIYAGNYEDLKDCCLIIIAAGAAQKPNQTRLDLVKQNVNVFKSIIPQITAVNTESIILVVTNPVDVLTYVTLKLSGFDKNRVLGSGTVLDTSRLKYLIGEYLNVDSKSVHAFVLGEHGDSELPVFSSANISGIDLDGYCKSIGKVYNSNEFTKIFENVKNSAYDIISKKGVTNYAIALVVTKIARTIVKDQHSILPVSCFVQNHYGISDICLGVPAIVGKNGVEQVLDIPLSGEENSKLQASANTLKDVIKQIGF